MSASRFLKYTERNWPNPVCSFYLPVSTSRDATVIACNLQSTFSLQHHNFNWHSNCLQFAIRCSFLQLQLAFKLRVDYNELGFCNTTTSTGIQIAYNLQSVALASNFNWHSNCLQFAIRCSFLQLQLTFKLHVNYNELAFCNTTTSTGIQIAYNLQSVWNCFLQHYNFNWHSNCLQLAIRCSCLQLQLAFKLPAIYNELALCKTTSTGIHIACNLQSVALAYNFNWHTNCLQLAIRCYLPTTTTGIQMPAI